MINQILCLFIPSIIALYINEQSNLYNGVRYYFMYVLFTNLFSYIVTIYLFEQPYIEFTCGFTVKYLILSSVITVVLAQGQKQFKKSISIELRREENECKKKHK